MHVVRVVTARDDEIGMFSALQQPVHAKLVKLVSSENRNCAYDCIDSWKCSYRRLPTMVYVGNWLRLFVALSDVFRKLDNGIAT